jgi:CheY-like chemotaxis protein
MKRLHSTILVVDDDETDLMFAEAAFKKIGATSKIQTATSGRDAIAYLLGEGKYADRGVFGYPDFVMTDLKMPGINGFDLLEHIRQDPISATIPVVVFSGSLDNDDVQKAYLSGANSFHLKPSCPTELRELLKALHDYWMTCELPAINGSAKKGETDGHYKLGTRFLESTAPWFMKPIAQTEPGADRAITPH